MYKYKAKLVKVIDGDTVKLDIDLGMNVWIRNENVRLYGINAPELRDEGGPEAREALKGYLDGKDIQIQTFKDKKGKYGRYLADIIADGLNACMWMVASGHAKRY